MPSQVLVGWGIGLMIVGTIWRFEKPAVALFKALGLWGQLGVALASVLILVGLQTTVIANREAAFETPAQWTERYHEARVFEDMLDGETDTEFRELALFDAIGVDNLGALMGMWLLAIFVVHRGVYERFSRQERIANVAIGLLVVAMLIPLMDLVENSLVPGVILWTSIPLLLGVGIPSAGKWVSNRWTAQRGMSISGTPQRRTVSSS